VLCETDRTHPLQKNFDVSVSFTGDMLKKITCSGSQNVCGKSAALLTTGEAEKHFYVRTSHEAGRRSQLPSCASCEDRGPTRCPPTAPRPAARLAAQRAPKKQAQNGAVLVERASETFCSGGVETQKNVENVHADLEADANHVTGGSDGPKTTEKPSGDRYLFTPHCKTTSRYADHYIRLSYLLITSACWAGSDIGLKNY